MCLCVCVSMCMCVCGCVAVCVCLSVRVSMLCFLVSINLKLKKIYDNDTRTTGKSSFLHSKTAYTQVHIYRNNVTGSILDDE